MSVVDAPGAAAGVDRDLVAAVCDTLLPARGEGSGNGAWNRSATELGISGRVADGVAAGLPPHVAAAE